jgi:hypothetical protein
MFLIITVFIYAIMIALSYVIKPKVIMTPEEKYANVLSNKKTQKDSNKKEIFKNKSIE